MKSLADALAKAQGEMKNAPLNKTNPHFKSKYADLAAIRDATIPALSKHGLSIVQYTKLREGALVLFTRLQHTSGEFIEGEYPIPNNPDKPQVMGSAQTYAKRYSWAAMCGIAADEDDDGNGAQQPKPTAQRQAAPSEEPATNEPPVIASPGPSAQAVAWKTYAKQLVEIAAEAPDAQWFAAFEKANRPGLTAMQNVSEATYAWTQQRLAEMLDQLRVPA